MLMFCVCIPCLRPDEWVLSAIILKWCLFGSDGFHIVSVFFFYVGFLGYVRFLGYLRFLGHARFMDMLRFRICMLGF